MTEDIPRRPDDEATARQVIELNPHNAIDYYNLGFLLAQDPARVSEAEAAYRKAIELEPDNAQYLYRLGLLLHENLHRPGEAKSHTAGRLHSRRTIRFSMAGLFSLLIQQSRRPDALALSVKMRALLRASRNWYGLATLDAILGNVNAAIEYLRKAAGEENFNRAWAREDTDLASIRDDPRFGEIVGTL